MFTKVLKRDDKLSSHSGRKSGYLWSLLRGGTLEQAMVSADHAIFKTARKYVKDAEGVADTIRRIANPRERLGVFKSCY